MPVQRLDSVEATVSGWGRYPVARTLLKRPEKISALTEIIESAEERKLLARGAGRSYGDASLNPDGLTVLTERLNRMLSFDPDGGILRCEAGVTLEDVLAVFVPRGWFPSVTPGTKYVTVGGLVGCDVHGKNHHQDGSVSRHLGKLRMAVASGDQVDCSASLNKDLFWATVGGMGLTGVILEAEMALSRIETAYMKVRKIKSRDLDETMALFEEHDSRYRYSVAWVDCLAERGGLGRSILMLGDHASLDDLDARARGNPLSVAPKTRLSVPADMPSGLLNRYSMGLFNGLYYAAQLAADQQTIVDYDSYFYPLDAILRWNRLYGKKGFVQYQCVIPPAESKKALTELLSSCSRSGRGSFLSVLKRFGEQEGLLSFPMPGYTLTLDMPVSPGLLDFLDELDRIVLRYGGRVYLAKDARLSAATMRQMYPNLDRWLAVKAAVDPDSAFSSALARRLELCPR
jgi:FAD/FMN-containing dehydrogenase